MKSRFSDPLKKVRRCQAECEEENYLSLVSRGCADPTSRPHFLPAHPHHDYSPAEKLKQVFSISCLKVHVRAIRQKGWNPHGGAAEEQNIEFCSPSWGHTLAQSPPRSVGWDKWEGKERRKPWCDLTPVLGQDWGVHPPTCWSSGALWIHQLRHSLQELCWLTGAMRSIEISLKFSVGPK